MIKIAINGYGRIGHAVLRAIYESGYKHKMQVVAINDSGKDIEIQAHITRYDSIHGMFGCTVDVVHSENALRIDGDLVKFYNQRDPKLLPWSQLDVDIVFECTGSMLSKEKALSHLTAGAKKVIISAPGASDVDATIVYGVNHHLLNSEMTVISNASCTTNCLAPIAKLLCNSVGIESGLMTTIHSYTNDQVLLDRYHSDPRRARSATMSMIPTKTGATKSVELVLPELAGKLDGLSIRVPTPNVSLVDFSCITTQNTSKEEINHIISSASMQDMQGIIAVSVTPSVSVDFVHNPASAICDLTQTKMINNNFVKILSWYDNEWGFANRMLDTAYALIGSL